jgi:COMPASS component SWD2
VTLENTQSLHQHYLRVISSILRSQIFPETFCFFMESSLQLNDRLLASYGVGRVFKDQQKSISSLDFTVDGKFLLSSADDDTVCIYDCEKAERTKLLSCKKYGVGKAKFVHSGNLSAIVTSRNDFDYSLRYWDLYENKFVRYFKGHISDVSTLDVHPYDDLFISSSSDKTSLLWDIRKEKPAARIPSRHTPASAFDNQGLVFGVCAGDQRVHLFDCRSFDHGEFTYFDLSKHLMNQSDHVSYLDFSPCGKYILITTEYGQVFTIDSFRGNLVATYSLSGESQNTTPSFSPDSQYVALASKASSVNIYRTVSHSEDTAKMGTVVARLEGHSLQPRVTLFNPTRCMLATSCVNIALWIPKQ